MSTEKELLARSASKCELCSTSDNLSVFEVPPNSNGSAEQCLLLCQTCSEQIETPEKVEANHWRCLNDSMWSQVPAVQVMAWRMLTRLSSEGWPQDLRDMLYLDEDVKKWAQETNDDASASETIKHRDSNGALIEMGDSVTLTKDLNVKGTSFTAKRGTVVRGISLVQDNHEQIEGRVNGQQIVILTKFVKKGN